MTWTTCCWTCRPAPVTCRSPSLRRSQTHMVIVTTPQAAAVSVAQRAARMADKVNIEVMGIIENMSYFQAAPDQPPIYIFGRGGGQRLAEVQGVPLLGEIPLDPAIREGGDEGTPITLSAPDSP